MSDERKRQIIDRLRTVLHMMDCHSEHPGGQDGSKVQVVVHGETMTLAVYGQRLNEAYTNEDDDEAVRLLGAIL